jgi:ribosomal protein S18 acetylase RimI-like enzyme
MTRASPSATLRRANIADVERLAPLFDAYRQFYRLPADLALSRDYLRARLARAEAVVLLAQAAEAPPAPEDAHRAAEPRATGFCLLYPGWCSLAAAPIFVLNDLYVTPDARRTGVGVQLLKAAEALGRSAGAVRLDLQTARTNAPAQALYESLGWRRDEVYLTYSLELAAV